jgi:hypothetical protein
MSAQIVIAAYRPHDGNDEALRALIREHLPALRKYELATDRPSMLMRSQDGTYLEIFEWASADSAQRAHEHPAIAKIWEGMGALGDMPTLSQLDESTSSFPHFEPVDL